MYVLVCARECTCVEWSCLCTCEYELRVKCVYTYVSSVSCARVSVLVYTCVLSVSCCMYACVHVCIPVCVCVVSCVYTCVQRMCLEYVVSVRVSLRVHTYVRVTRGCAHTSTCGPTCVHV